MIYEPGAAIVWFVFPDVWHDLGRFHLEDGTFTGYYVNLITPVQIDGTTWRMFDLCLDLWIGADGRFQVLDQDEFDEAVDRCWIDPATAEQEPAGDQPHDQQRRGREPHPQQGRHRQQERADLQDEREGQPHEIRAVLRPVRARPVARPRRNS